MLTAKQERFVAAYDGNATKAAIEAGYSPKWADRQAHLLLEKNREVQLAIKAREAERRQGLIATREKRQAFWSEVMMDENETMATRLRASELLAKSEGDFMSSVTVDGNFDVALGLAALLQEVSPAD
jgi:phage terminase small subunit